ncbi:MAG: hypothetical protein OQL08_12735 [Gammaproteobacteria bacterium]|nr:hypothetical protein [Gammaproteobacteria bacterium]
MERYIFLGVLLFTLLALAIGIMVPGNGKPEAPPEAVYLPWQVDLTASGSSRVLGLELGHSTLAEAQQRFRAPYEVSLFAHDGGERVVEAYFDSITLNGLRARVVLVMALTPEQLDGLYGRGVRIATLGSGSRKVTLADSDLQQLAALPFTSLTYIPKLDLSAELIEARFGLPAERVRERRDEGRVEHWLYPQLGLDVALHEKGKEVLQYVPPAHFERLRRPLLEQGALLAH